jgi:hypothetical protein
MSSSLSNPFPVSDNSQYPFAYSETYLPDQLIAGNMKLVTDTVLVTGGGVYPRGAVMGLSSEGALASSAGKTYSSGTVTVAAVPTAADTLTINGTVITFVAANPTGNQVLIGGPGVDGDPVATPTIAGTVTALINFLDNSTDVNLIKLNYSVAGAVITVTNNTIGTPTFTMSTSDSTAFTLSAVTAGSANTGAETIGSLSAGRVTKPGNYLISLTSATAFNVYDPNGVELAPGTVGTAYLDPQIGFTVTTGSGIAAGDQFVIAAAPGGTGDYTLAVGSATDGSQNPAAILADVANTVGGAVNAPVYLMGEFNINAMTFGNGISVAAAKAALRPFGIILKTAQTAADPS